MIKEYDNDLVNKLNFEDVLLDSLPNPVYYKDTKGKFIRCNKAFSSLVQTSKDKIIGKSAYDFFPVSVSNRHKEIDKIIMETLGTNSDEIIFPCITGEVKYFILNKAVYLNPDGTIGGIVSVMNDITSSVKEKEFLIQQSKFAEMGEMIASIAHQWNEPLVELSAQVQKVEFFHDLNKLDKNKMSDFVKDSMIQIKYMSETLSDFRNFLKPSCVKQSFGIKQAIKEIFEIVGKQIFYFNIKVNFELGNENEEIFIYSYKNELKQVLLNVINNAKHKIVKKEESEDYKAEITISVHEDNIFTIIEIKDNAGSIEKEILSHLFEPFFTTKDDGTGFGLHMSKVIIEDKIQGLISARNEDNCAVFKICIPKVNK